MTEPANAVLDRTEMWDIFPIRQSVRIGMANHSDRPSAGSSHELDTPKGNVLRAFRYLMRPLVTMLIRSGIAFGEFAEVAKTVFVEIASSEFALGERKGLRISHCHPYGTDSQGRATDC